MNIIEFKKIFKYSLVALSLVLLGFFIFYLFYTFSAGTLNINLVGSNIAYRIDNSQNSYTSSQTIKRISVGDHEIRAFGTISGNLTPQVFKIKVKANQVNTVNVNLAYTAKNPDFSGVEMPNVLPDLKKTNPLISYLPYSKNGFYFDYEITNNNINYYIAMNDREPATTNPVLEDVKAYIKSKGINPETVFITWRDKSF